MLPAIPIALGLANQIGGGFVGDLVENVVGQATGNENLGKLAGIFADFKTGNVFGAASRAVDLINNVDDFRIQAEVRWGAGSAEIICGGPHEVARTCPGPKETNFSFSARFGLVGFSVDVKVGGGNPGEAIAAAKDGCKAPSAGPDVCPAPSSGMKSILDDPTLSLEAKVALLFAQMIDDLDEEIEGKLGEMEAASKAQGKGKGKEAESAGNDFNRISTEVQMLMQKRSQMYGLQSNMMSMFNDVSMQIINNVR